MYRAFKLGDLDRYFLIKEGWDLGTPGKVWNSALVISDLFVQKIIHQPTCFENLHLLDLSAGTGTAGLLINYVYKHMFPHHRPPRITLTDLPEAFLLIYYNKEMNGINAAKKELTVEPLSWGWSNDIHQLQIKPPMDIIIASDVLYEPIKFGVLVSTLVDLSEPGRTVIYLGYKRRGLKDTEEQQFFDLCDDHFDIQVLDYDYGGGNDDEDKVGEQDENKTKGGGSRHHDHHKKHHHHHHHRHTKNNNNNNNKKGTGKKCNDEVGWETEYGKLMKNGARMDGEGWLGPFAGNWRATHRQDKNVTRQLFPQTGVQVYRLTRKQH